MTSNYIIKYDLTVLNKIIQDYRQTMLSSYTRVSIYHVNSLNSSIVI